MIQSRTTVITISVNLVPETDFQGFSGLFISKAHFSLFFFFLTRVLCLGPTHIQVTAFYFCVCGGHIFLVTPFLAYSPDSM